MTANTFRPAVAPVAAASALALLLAACGGGGEDPTAPVPARPEGKPEQPAASARPPADVGDPNFATAVATGKTAAGVDLKYDLPAKPAPAQDFEVALALLPRVQADTLEVEVTGIEGLSIVNGATAKFDNVLSGETYPATVTVRADKPGLYYLGVAAKMITQVQTEARTFSVPVVVGNVVAAEKTAPATDAAGQPVESMPAEETSRQGP
jgi:lipoprotein-anchoring transpeptidase ErfK/SrfK